MSDEINRVVVYSGGMDSYTLLRYTHKTLGAGEALFALSFDYGQRHRRELQKAVKVCGDLGVRHQIVDLSMLRPMLQGSALTDNRVAVPHGHYEEASMKRTVVPGRNTLMLACALAFAEGLHPTHKAVIYYGAHAGDHHIYPDCRPGFIAAMADAIHQGSDGRVRLSTPYQSMTKGAILASGLKLGLSSYDYANTWTCYEGGEHPCGKCGSCVERAEAFDFAGVADPLIVARDASQRVTA